MCGNHCSLISFLLFFFGGHGDTLIIVLLSCLPVCSAGLLCLPQWLHDICRPNAFTPYTQLKQIVVTISTLKITRLLFFHLYNKPCTFFSFTKMQVSLSNNQMSLKPFIFSFNIPFVVCEWLCDRKRELSENRSCDSLLHNQFGMLYQKNNCYFLSLPFHNFFADCLKSMEYEVQAFLKAIHFYRQEKGHYESWDMLVGTECQVGFFPSVTTSLKTEAK